MRGEGGEEVRGKEQKRGRKHLTLGSNFELEVPKLSLEGGQEGDSGGRLEFMQREFKRVGTWAVGRGQERRRGRKRNDKFFQLPFWGEGKRREKQKEELAKKVQRRAWRVSLKAKPTINSYLPSFLSSSLVFVSISLSTKAGGGLLIPELVFLQSTSKMIAS